MTAISPVVEGVPVCDERAQRCRCHKPAGHVDAGDPVHACDPNRCTGQWSGGDIDDPASDFRVVTIPRQVGPRRPWDFE